jgi:hypothetical protein
MMKGKKAARFRVVNLGEAADQRIRDEAGQASVGLAIRGEAGTTCGRHQPYLDASQARTLAAAHDWPYLPDGTHGQPGQQWNPLLQAVRVQAEQGRRRRDVDRSNTNIATAQPSVVRAVRLTMKPGGSRRPCRRLRIAWERGHMKVANTSHIQRTKDTAADLASADDRDAELCKRFNRGGFRA